MNYIDILKSGYFFENYGKIAELKKDLDIKKDLHNEKASEIKKTKAQTKKKSYQKGLKKWEI